MPKDILFLHEDERFLVVDKPSGIVVIPSPKREKNTVTSLVNEQKGGVQEYGKLHPCHRLDAETSGCLIFAKGKRNQQVMMKLFREKKIYKRYIALIHGRIDPSCGTLRDRITPFRLPRGRYSQQAYDAVTKYKTLEIREQFSILEAEPLTGKTNQIRIHFAQKGCPIVGERKYAVAKRFPIRCRRVALHAKEVRWPDPDTGTIVRVQSQLAKDMEVFCDRSAN